jgi:hypothetical protein
MSAEQDMLTRITLILNSKSVQKIDFQLNSVHIDGSQLNVVIGYLATKQWGMGGIEIDIGHVDPKAWAEYDATSNKFLFPTANFGVADKLEKSAIVHECIHAWLDIRMPTGHRMKDGIVRGALRTTMATDEAAAYVGEFLYYLYETTPKGGKPTLPAGWTDSPVYREGHRIAASIMNKSGAKVSDADVDVLKRAIMESKTYTFIKANPTGNYNNNGI